MDTNIITASKNQHTKPDSACVSQSAPNSESPE